MIDIISCSTKQAVEWDQFLLEHPQGNFYQRYGWKHINEKNFSHQCFFQAAMENGKITGVFPMVYVKSRLFGNILSSMPFVNFGGLCADSNDTAKQLLDHAEELTSTCGADYLEIRSTEQYARELPAATHKISMVLDLDKDPDVLWNAFKSKHRTNIRRVYKNSIHVRQGRHDLLDDFYTLLSKSWKGLGTPIYRKSYFADILNTFPEETRIFIAYQNDLPVAAAFNGYYKDIVEGMWAGALPEQRSIQANYVLYWEMIKDACEKGYARFHLGRSTADTGAEAFKKKWNAYAMQLYWQYILNSRDSIPQLNVNNPRYEMAIKLWRKLPLQVTTVLGPLIARSIP